MATQWPAPDMRGFTPGEVADLRIVRGRAAMDKGDNAPMLRVTYREIVGSGTCRIERVIPWPEAVNLNVDRNGEIISRNIPPWEY